MTRQSSLLIIEPRVTVREKMVSLFETEDIKIKHTASVKEASKWMMDEEFDIIISELKCDDGTVLEVSRVIKNNQLDTYLLLWTRETDMSVLYQCYKAGVDSINSKSRPQILVKAKVLAMLRRINAWREKVSHPVTIEIGKVKLDKETRQVRIAGKYIKTTTTEYKILKFLLEKIDTITSKEELISHIWLDNNDRRNIDVYIHRLRSKVGKLITTKRKKGYIIYSSTLSA